MKCDICNSNLEEIVVDPRDGRIKPCFKCRSEIEDTVTDYEVELPLEDLIIIDDRPE